MKKNETYENEFEQWEEQYIVQAYYDWRKICDDIEQDWDCGLEANREDFSNFACLPQEISFATMLELELSYKEMQDNG